MNFTITCKDCRQQSFASLHGQAVRCQGCRRILLIGDNQERALWSTTAAKNQASQVNGKISKRERFKDFLKMSSGTKSNASCAYPSSNPRILVTPMSHPPRGKRAFLCGVTYKGQKMKVRGALQDVASMRSSLVERFGFPIGSILILAEEEPYRSPTKSNIQEGFKWLTADLRRGDSLVFYFSGHGKRQRDYNRDEMDGFDEAICPVDFPTQGLILDNEINESIVRPLKKGVILHAFIDACHSGTMLDLQHVYNKDNAKWDHNRPPSGAYKGTSGGRVICFSACEDYQLAADTSAFSSGRNMSGAMTHTFVKAVESIQKVTYGGILQYMHEAIEETSQSPNGCPCRRILRGFNHSILQDPQLSSSEEFDVNSEFNL